MNGTNGTNGTNGEAHGVQLPSAKPFDVNDNIVVQPPLTRRGHGPALILVVPKGINLKGHEKTLDPPPLQKWAEEGFAVAQIIDGGSNLQSHLKDALSALRKLSECDSCDRVGLISFNVENTPEVSKAIDSIKDIVAVISYGENYIQTAAPKLRHISGKSSKPPGESTKIFEYPDAKPYFVIPGEDDFKSAAAAVSHTRSLAFLKPLTQGPYFDLEAIWDEHCKFEFGERAVEKTMGTMVQEPYVNHIPTITGGIGRDRLTQFYANHFIFNNPDDTALELVSRTVGIDRVIDEFVFSFTHDRMIDWLAPGIPPTGKKCELPFTSVVNIRGDRLYHEHIGWDQATLLRQMGLMPEYLPFPYAVDGRKPAAGKSFEYRVPTAGVEITRKLVDERSVESNHMFDFKVREVANK